MTHISPIIAETVNGSSFVSLDTRTTVHLTGGKKNDQLGRVSKVTTGLNVMIFHNKKVNGYDAMVRRRLTKEGKNPDNFILQPRRWGKRLPNEPFIEHKGQHYLEVIALTSGNSHYELDGTPIDKKDIVGLSQPTAGEQGGLDDKVIIRTFKLDNITKLKVNKQEFTNINY